MMFGLADCNNFFVSCERVFHPSLRDKPVIVLSNNDGCAVALSNEAKALGFKRGDPYFKIRSDAERHGVAVLSGSHRMYGDMSRRVMSSLASIVPDGRIEFYSIDECFINIPDTIGDPLDFGRYAVRTVLRHTGIPISLGIAPTRTLAKVAARFAKKYPGYKGACIIDTEEKRLRALRLTDVSDVWGIGRRSAARLHCSGVNSALEFASLSVGQIRGLFSITGERTWRELNGEPCIVHEDPDIVNKTITSSRSFITDIRDFELLRQAVCSFAAIAGRKLRRMRGYARSVAVWVATNRFHEHEPQYSNSAEIMLPEAADDTPTLARHATEALRAVFRPEFAYKRAGFTVTRIVSADGMQPSLFADVDDISRRHRLMSVVDSLNESSLAPDMIHLASEGSGLAPLTGHSHKAPDDSTAQPLRIYPELITDPDSLGKILRG